MKQRIRERVRDDLVRLVGARLDLDSLIDEAARLIAQAVPFDGACWHTMDPATLIGTGSRLMNMPSHCVLMAENEYLHNDFNKFVALVRSQRHSGVLSEATGDLHRSFRYREFLRPSGLLGELRAAFVVDNSCWGCVAFFRAAPADFTADERDLAHELAATLARGFRAAVVRAGSGSPAPGPGLILFDGSRRVEAITTTGRAWLAELGFTGEPTRDFLPHALFAVAECARTAAADATSRVPGVSGGWVQLHASVAPGGEPGRVAIILQSPTPASLAPLIAAGYGLTRRERELTELVLQGYVTRDIAQRLVLSPHTVQEHLKSIFAKTGVHSRRELVGNVFSRHYQPRIQPVGIERT